MGDPKRGIILLLILVSLAVSITEIGVSNAQPGTLVVPDDYPTLASAIGNATEGDTVFVKKGTYEGPINQTLVINKTITLIGEEPGTTVLNMYPQWIPQTILNPYDGYANSIEIQANDVEISGFTINSEGAYEGAYLLTSGNSTQIISNNLNLNLFLMGSHENVVQNNLALGISCYGSRGTITRNNVTRAISIGGSL